MGRHTYTGRAAPTRGVVAPPIAAIAKVQNARAFFDARACGICNVGGTAWYQPQSHFACPKQGSNPTDSEGSQSDGGAVSRPAERVAGAVCNNGSTLRVLGTSNQ